MTFLTGRSFADSPFSWFLDWNYSLKEEQPGRSPEVNPGSHAASYVEGVNRKAIPLALAKRTLGEIAAAHVRLANFCTRVVHFCTMRIKFEPDSPLTLRSIVVPRPPPSNFASFEPIAPLSAPFLRPKRSLSISEEPKSAQLTEINGTRSRGSSGGSAMRYASCLYQAHLVETEVEEIVMCGKCKIRNVVLWLQHLTSFRSLMQNLCKAK